VRLSLCALLLALAVLPCAAQEVPLPAELSFIYKFGKPYRMTYEPWTEMQMPPGNLGSGGVGKMMRGKHWEFPIIVAGAKSPAAVWAILKPAFLANGWTMVREFTSGGHTLWIHYQKDGVEADAITDADDAERATVNMVEVAPMPFTFSLTPPSAKLEPVDAAKGDFPWLGPLPGSKYRSGEVDPTPFKINVKGAPEPERISGGSIDKIYYAPKDGFSNSLFRIAYHDALVKAGWTIVDEFMGSDVSISAHYTKNGRNIWAKLHKSDYYDIQVADVGATTKDLGADLAKNCHVALYGVLFDFNKSTLQTASDPVLEQILGLLTKDAALKLDIQGHTDNVGNDAYNQTLSEARARAVVAWLTQHGIAAGRLTAKGFGKTVPIAPNTTDEGRAKNRRVEIADPRCKAQAK
jgi:outer membrane protein OmpA-like peptidoglycan-associated protein